MTLDGAVLSGAPHVSGGRAEPGAGQRPGRTGGAQGGRGRGRPRGRRPRRHGSPSAGISLQEAGFLRHGNSRRAPLPFAAPSQEALLHREEFLACAPLSQKSHPSPRLPKRSRLPGDGSRTGPDSRQRLGPARAAPGRAGGRVGLSAPEVTPPGGRSSRPRGFRLAGRGG